MIYSMTGFGRAEASEGKRKFTVELKSVNHRYLDLNIKMPKQLNALESEIRSFLKEQIGRGKVDVYITCEKEHEDAVFLKYNASLAASYLKYLRAMAEEFELEDDIRVSTLSRYPDVFVMEETPADEEELWNGLREALTGACRQFVAARAAEGENLKADLLDKLEELLSDVQFIEKRSPEIMAEYRQRLEDKVKELLGDRQLDDARIATEVTIYADKICVDEETVRLKSHIFSMKDALTKGGAIGRKLDFIAQEMNREANTILSKANNIEISDVGINLKTGIEKIREQIQNIE